MPEIPTEPLRAIRPLQRTAGIDWWRCIYDRPADAEAALLEAQRIQGEDVLGGSKVRRWKFQQYEGWQTDSIRWGRLRGSVLCETSGRLAPGTWGRMPRSGGRCTRLDTQTTLLLSQPQPGCGMQWLQLGETTRRRRPQCQLKRGLKWETTGYWCGTVAARTSPKHGRVYDKGVELGSHVEGEMWRVEIEAKYELAEALWETLKEVPDVTQWSAASCRSLWESWGLHWPVPPSDELHVSVSAPSRPAPTVEALGRWAERTVAPTIPRLLCRYSVAEVLTMLGLDAYAEPTDDYRTGRRAVAGTGTP